MQALRSNHCKHVNPRVLGRRRMECVSDRTPASIMCRARSLFQLILVVIVTTLLLQSSSSEGTSVGFGSIKAELFHREHPFSLSARPPDDAEKPQSDGSRSAKRYEHINKRRLSGKSSHVDGKGPPTLTTDLSTAAPYEYLMSISLGTPAQNFVAVADTGSALTWLQCKPSSHCYRQPSPHFDPFVSSTFQNLTCSSQGCLYLKGQVKSCKHHNCEYSYSYADNSFAVGYLSSDTLNLKSTAGENVSVADFWFGCSHWTGSHSGLYNLSDGMVGLAPGPLAFPSQLAGVVENKFSYCLVSRSLTAVRSSPLVFGSDAVPDMELQFTPILKNPAHLSWQYFYYIGLEGISVDGEAVDFDATAFAINASTGDGGTILDSGTTYTYLPPVVVEALVSAIDAKVGSRFERVIKDDRHDFTEKCDRRYRFTALCYHIDRGHRRDLPTISFKLGHDTSWNLDAENVWVFDHPCACLTVVKGTEGYPSVIGNLHQRNFHVLYDQVEKRIGFAKTDCGAFHRSVMIPPLWGQAMILVCFLGLSVLLLTVMNGLTPPKTSSRTKDGEVEGPSSPGGGPGETTALVVINASVEEPLSPRGDPRETSALIVKDALVQEKVGV